MTYNFVTQPQIAPEDSFTTTYSDLTAAGAFIPGQTVAVIDSSYGLQVFGFYKFDNGSGNVAGVAGGPVGFLNGSSWNGYTVTNDISDTKSNMLAGIQLSVVTDTYYAWYQTWGYYATIATNGDDDIAAGDTLIWDADNAVNSVAAATAPTYRIVGSAVAADVDAANTVAGYITILGGR